MVVSFLEAFVYFPLPVQLVSTSSSLDMDGSHTSAQQSRQKRGTGSGVAPQDPAQAMHFQTHPEASHLSWSTVSVATDREVHEGLLRYTGSG